MTKILELFGFHYASDQPWDSVLDQQQCPYVEKRCYKVRKSQPDIAIGTCTVSYRDAPIVICPTRLLERRQIFTDCLHLLTGHEPGNELHVLPEIKLPGGVIDYVLASTHKGKTRDFVGIELQTLDTTGTVWPERQRFLMSKGIKGLDFADTSSTKKFGMNWKMTAKTILVQLHHKIQTFENVNKHLVLLTQDRLLEYMMKEFSFGHLNSARTSDPMHFHAYELVSFVDGFRLELTNRLSTDTSGIAQCLGLQSNANVEIEVIQEILDQRISERTYWDLGKAVPPIDVDPAD